MTERRLLGLNGVQGCKSLDCHRQCGDRHIACPMHGQGVVQKVMLLFKDILQHGSGSQPRRIVFAEHTHNAIPAD